MEIDYCYHCHTKRCGHAIGEDEEYVINAIEAGIKVLGFSDHVFLPNLSQPKVRGEFDQLDNYIASVRYLQEKYKDKIKILLAFECEYFDEYESYYKDLLENKGFDYLLLGQHFVMENGEMTYTRNCTTYEARELYLSQIEKGLKSGLFKYLCHPDLFVTSMYEFDEYAKDLSYRICKLCKKLNVPIELNLNGMDWRPRPSLRYPLDEFWEIAGKVGNDVVIGYDCHQPDFFTKTIYLDKAKCMVKKYNLKLVELR